MTAALEGCDWSAACPGRTLPPGKTRYPFYRRLGGPQGRSGRAENLVPTGIRSRTVQPVVSPCTDWATRPTRTLPVLLIILSFLFIIFFSFLATLLSYRLVPRLFTTGPAIIFISLEWTAACRCVVNRCRLVHRSKSALQFCLTAKDPSHLRL